MNLGHFSPPDVLKCVRRMKPEKGYSNLVYKFIKTREMPDLEIRTRG